VKKVFGQKTTENLDVNYYVSSRDKYHKVVEILELPLRKIAENYANKKYTQFTPQELHDFIKALFTESTLRSEILSQIK